MEKNTKLITGLMITLIAIGTLAIVPSVVAENSQPNQEGTRPALVQALRRLRGHPWLRYLLKNGELYTLEGEAATFKGPILVVQTGEETVNVNIPCLWVVGSEVMNRTNLFDEDPFTLGETTLTIDTLMLRYEKDTHTITAYFAYRISGDGVEANALLPFNIETTTP